MSNGPTHISYQSFLISLLGHALGRNRELEDEREGGKLKKRRRCQVEEEERERNEFFATRGRDEWERIKLGLCSLMGGGILIKSSGGHCDAPFPGGPLTTRQPAKIYMSRITRHTHE